MARKTGSHSRNTAPKVRDAALRLFARFGYAAVSMRRIAAEVGVQAGALYAYTPDKQSLLFELMNGHMKTLLKTAAIPRPRGDILNQIDNFTRVHIEFHLKRPDATFVAYMELRNLDAANFAVIEQLRRTYEDRLESLIIAGRESGLLTVPDSKLAVMAVIAMLTGVNTWFRDDGRLDRAGIVAIYQDMIRRALGAQN